MGTPYDRAVKLIRPYGLILSGAHKQVYTPLVQLLRVYDGLCFTLCMSRRYSCVRAEIDAPHGTAGLAIGTPAQCASFLFGYEYSGWNSEEEPAANQIGLLIAYMWQQ